MKVVDTDNFGGDYPNEKVFIDNIESRELAQRIADAVNKHFYGYEEARRFFRVEEDDYVLQPGFEP